MRLLTEVPYPDLPSSFDVGPLTVYWYGVMYAVGFLLAWVLGTVLARRTGSGWSADQVSDLILYSIVGVVVGGRLGYTLFYGLENAVADPVSVLRIYEGGMSFHGGLLGVLVALGLYARRAGRSFFAVSDFVAPLVPPGLFFGRIGNFINAELWGKETAVPWGMVFPGAGDEPRHPTMLYEALLEGLLLFGVLWWYTRRSPPVGAVSGLFLLLYGVVRVLVEFLRVPDAHLGYLALEWVTMGQVLSAPMVVVGGYLLWSAHRKPSTIDPPGAARDRGQAHPDKSVKRVRHVRGGRDAAHRTVHRSRG
ncbi:prolipoprotein diacylglyceryl transferase [Serinicoccus chungangensis]|uniref:prolipoprotein diacylglyceryl transferase n=1 Tax=Serinicoccus chungangensis TaxID=767452 RepID=UPI000AC05F3A|nr:prolipoprotein diacylglyceryl transferase [Serinicoccus chungangensis]